MIDPHEFALVLQSGVSLIGIVALVLFLFSDYRLDDYRDRLFELRARLLELSLTGDLPIEHPAYRLTQIRIESLSRYAHKVKLTMFVVYKISALILVKLGRDNRDKPERHMRRALEGLPRYMQFNLINLNNDIDRVTLHRMLFVRVKVDATASLLPAGLPPTSQIPHPKPFETHPRPVLQAVESQALKSYELGYCERIA